MKSGIQAFLNLKAMLIAYLSIEENEKERSKIM